MPRTEYGQIQSDGAERVAQDGSEGGFNAFCPWSSVSARYLSSVAVMGPQGKIRAQSPLTGLRSPREELCTNNIVLVVMEPNLRVSRIGGADFPPGGFPRRPTMIPGILGITQIKCFSLSQKTVSCRRMHRRDTRVTCRRSAVHFLTRKSGRYLPISKATGLPQSNRSAPRCCVAPRQSDAPITDNVNYSQ